jgi:hypothetical protein
MMAKENSEQRGKHPREDLSFTCNRRTAFRAILQEAAVIGRALKGTPTCRIAELGSLPDEKLAQVKPMVNPGFEINLEQGCVWATYKPKEKPAQKLFAMAEKDHLLAFNMFTGTHTLGEIGRHLAREMAWEETQAFARLRDFFLSLVKLGVCLPKDPVE